MPNQIPVVFHNGSNYDYLFMTKELANKLEGQFESFEVNIEKNMTFFDPTEKEVTKVDKYYKHFLRHKIY